MRGEPNAVGIITKRFPNNNPSAFFKDDELEEWISMTDGDFARLQEHLIAGNTVIMPYDGIGTGRAQLARTSPRIWRQLNARLAILGIRNGG